MSLFVMHTPACPALSRPLRVLIAGFTMLLLSACADGGSNSNSTLGVPGSGNNNTVAVTAADIEGPVAGAPSLVSTFFDLGALGYEQAEFFVSGTANAYSNVNEFKSNGKWQVQASEQAPYKTRIVVYRPSDPADFNGTVVVEWLNVSAGFDASPDWGMLHTELIRSGYAWVGVSAQKVGVDALKAGSGPVGSMDDDRYASLEHPEDRFSYDIYSQVGEAIRNPGSVAPLGNLQAQRLIAAGESQSADRMMTYLNAIAPMHAIYDGYFVHSRLSGSAPLQGSFLEPILDTPEVVRVRTDLGTPVMMFQTETDLFVLGSYPDNQPDNKRFRLWEVAGTAHADLYTFLDNRLDIGNNPAVAAVVENLTPVPTLIECPIAVNAGPQHFVAKAAMAALNTWLVDGTAPPRADRLAVSGNPAALELDVFGNARGGVRTPYVDTPIAVLSGEGQPPLVIDPENPDLNIDNIDFCFLSGTTVLFDATTLGSLYASNADYIEKLNAATDMAVTQGFLLPPDAQLIKDYAASSDIFAPK